MSDATTIRRSTRKAKGSGHQRRAEILEAAERIFVAEGYEGATIRKIADEVGVSSTALYMHFPDKSRILQEISDRALKLLLERNLEISAKPLDPVTRVRQMLEAYIRWGLAHPNAYQLVYSAPRPTSACADDMRDISTHAYDIFVDVVREIAAAGRLRAGTPDSVAQSLWMSCHGVVTLLTVRRDFPWAPQEELIGVTLDTVVAGMVAD